jgi:GTPase SAR1 family protein
VGKSTVVKQLTSSIGKGFNDAERVIFLEAVYENLVTTAVNLTEFCTKDEAATTIYTDALDMLEAFSDMKDDFELKSIRGVITAEGDALQALQAKMTAMREIVYNIWHVPAIKAAIGSFKESIDLERLLKADCCLYFLEIESNWKRLCSPDFLPSDADIIRLRLPSQGIVNYDFEFEDYQFTLRDVGGQLHHQETWRTGFDGASAALFVVNLCDYRNFTQRHDRQENVLEQTRKLLMKIAVTKGFTDLPYVVLFNKIDKFKEEIKTQPLNTCPRFHDIKGQQDSESDDAYCERCQRIIKKYFLSGFRKAREADNPDTKFSEARTFFSCALDADMTKVIMSKVIRGIITASISNSAF